MSIFLLSNIFLFKFTYSYLLFMFYTEFYLSNSYELFLDFSFKSLKLLCYFYLNSSIYFRKFSIILSCSSLKSSISIITLLEMVCSTSNSSRFIINPIYFSKSSVTSFVTDYTSTRHCSYSSIWASFWFVTGNMFSGSDFVSFYEFVVIECWLWSVSSRVSLTMDEIDSLMGSRCNKDW